MSNTPQTLARAQISQGPLSFGYRVAWTKKKLVSILNTKDRDVIVKLQMLYSHCFSFKCDANQSNICLLVSNNLLIPKTVCMGTTSRIG
ncbi:hypothetical protein Sjap_002273 [Stephania japonica]|uniref:Uncharacterized protein n=1 Tax=Stephania japonica TaxID=461633 RepID=A0AAP0PSD7_9MAGN